MGIIPKLVKWLGDTTTPQLLLPSASSFEPFVPPHKHPSSESMLAMTDFDTDTIDHQICHQTSPYHTLQLYHPLPFQGHHTLAHLPPLTSQRKNFEHCGAPNAVNPSRSTITAPQLFTERLHQCVEAAALRTPLPRGDYALAPRPWPRFRRRLSLLLPPPPP
jgi:hypothetical protein